MTIPVPPSPTAATFERLLRRLDSDQLRELSGSLGRAAWRLDQGRPDEALTCLGSAVELLDTPGGHDTPDSASTCAIDLLDRARYDLERGWTAAAYDAAARAVRIIDSMTYNTREVSP